MPSRKNIKSKHPPRTIEEWAASKNYLKWPLIGILIAIFLLVILIGNK